MRAATHPPSFPPINVDVAGQSTPLTKEQLSALYPDADAYLKAWNDAIDNIRTQGLSLESDSTPRAPAAARLRPRSCAPERVRLHLALAEITFRAERIGP